ncbi:m158 protein [Murid betaherpesvirus 1]|uniref:M158 protein n=1 Tax=Murid herpesvirus 1 TaxID=10366 RepID=H2A2Z6_MUHV1|nr:m158 protein [Murid betaherpesvirus 1]
MLSRWGTLGCLLVSAALFSAQEFILSKLPLSIQIIGYLDRNVQFAASLSINGSYRLLEWQRGDLVPLTWVVPNDTDELSTEILFFETEGLYLANLRDLERGDQVIDVSYTCTFGDDVRCDVSRTGDDRPLVSPLFVDASDPDTRSDQKKPGYDVLVQNSERIKRLWSPVLDKLIQFGKPPHTEVEFCNVTGGFRCTAISRSFLRLTVILYVDRTNFLVDTIPVLHYANASVTAAGNFSVTPVCKIYSATGWLASVKYEGDLQHGCIHRPLTYEDVVPGVTSEDEVLEHLLLFSHLAPPKTTVKPVRNRTAASVSVEDNDTTLRTPWLDVLVVSLLIVPVSVGAYFFWRWRVKRRRI